MKSMSNENSDDNNNSNKNNWLGFSLCPNMTMESPPSHNQASISATTSMPMAMPANFFNFPTNFNYIYGAEGENGGGVYSSFPVMPIKSDGSLCLMEAMSRSQTQGIMSSNSNTPKLENFFGGVTMGAHDFDRGAANAIPLSLDMYNSYHHNVLQNNTPRYQQQQIQPQHYPDYSGFRGLYQTVQEEEQEKEEEGEQITANHCTSHNLTAAMGGGEDELNGMKNWVSRTHGGECGSMGGYRDLQSLSLSMSPGSQSSSGMTGSAQISPTTVIDSVVVNMDTKKRGSEKVDQKKIVHRKSLDTFGQRTSQFRGVTRHRWTGRYEAHLWDNSCKKEGQSRKGRQVYLGGYDMEEKAARAYDLAALKYWGPSTHINFTLENYERELEEMKNMSRQEYVAHLRRRSSGFSRGASIYRGVTRHHQHGRWQARIGRVAGNKDLYLGTFSTQEEAAEAYDIAAIKFRGTNAVTNFDTSRYNVESIMASNTLLPGELARRTNVVISPNIEANNHENVSEWKMALYHSSQQDYQKTGNLESFSVVAQAMKEAHQQEEGDNESVKTGTHMSNSSSLVTSLGSSREGSPDRNNQHNNIPMAFAMPPTISKFIGTSSTSAGTSTWIPTGQPHIPVFAAWSD